jgi:hypothetical protein
MLEFNWNDVPFYRLSDELPFIGKSLPEFSLGIQGFNGDYAKILLLVFLIAYFILYSIVAGVLFYHWNRYGMQTKNILFAKIVFSVCSLCLYGVLFLLALSL